jgi:hypothetical protein
MIATVPPMAERRLPASDLVGTQEIADRLGLSHRETVNTLRRRHADFPAPFGRIGAVRIWSWTDVEAWARRTGRLPAAGDGDEEVQPPSGR